MHMSRRLAGSVVRRPFERTRVRHRDADGRRRRIAQHDLLLLLVLAVDVDTIDVVAARGRLAAGGIVADIGRRTASPTRRTLLARTGRVAGISAFRPPAAAGAILVVAPLQRGRHAPPHLMTLRAHSDGSRPASMTPAGQAVDTSRPAVIVGQFLLVRLVGDARVMRMVRLLIVVVVLRQASVDAARPLAEHEPGIGRHVPFQINHVIHIARHAPGHRIGHRVVGQRYPRRLSATPQFDHGGQLDGLCPRQLRRFNRQPIVDGRRRR